MSTSLAARLAMLAAGTAALTACSGQHPGHASDLQCSLARAGYMHHLCQQHDAQIIVSPGDQAQRDELIKDLAGGDAFWSYTRSRCCSPM